jgi:hypothetical protein
MWDIAHQQFNAYINGIWTQIAASPMLIIDFATFWARYQEVCRQQTVDASHPSLRYRVLPFRQASLESRWNDNPNAKNLLDIAPKGVDIKTVSVRLPHQRLSCSSLPRPPSQIKWRSSPEVSMPTTSFMKREDGEWIRCPCWVR